MCSFICIKGNFEIGPRRIVPVLMLAMLAFALVIVPAMAGTETGEFCPTCPDWTDLDGWLAKKQAYEQEGLDQVTGKAGTAKVDEGSSMGGGQKPVQKERYPHFEMIAEPGAGIRGKALIDARSPGDYSQGHLSGARNLYWKDLQHSGRLDPAAAEKMLRKAGINNSDDLLVYGGSDGGPEFLFWALSYLGHRNISVLDGGIDAATGAGMILDSSAPQVAESNYTAHPVQSMLVDENGLGSALAGDVQVLDARDFSDYGLSRLTGNAMQVSTDKLYQDSLLLAGPEDLKDLFEGRGLDRNRTQIVYGTPKAYVLFYCLELMGYQASLIEGTWWSKTKWAISNVR
ncbi:MAG TPA: rhodanese-like domain-containing protein [Methanotrichaceae archaeon]|nr:rhodanese-like domain-containing protein [Methanotrichaceae archaeon]